MGVEPGVRLAHALEDAFVAAQQGKIHLAAGDIDVCLRAADVLGSLAEVREETLPQWTIDHEITVGELATLLSALAQGKTAPGLSVAPPPEVVVAPEPLAIPVVAPQAIPIPSPPSPPAEATTSPTAEPAEAVVRVTAQSLTRLMSLAGESLVQGRWLQPFATSLLKLKKRQDHLVELLNNLAQARTEDHSDQAASLVAEAQQQSVRCRQGLTERIAEFEDHAAQAEDLNSRLYREVILSRMRPFADVAHGFPRMVRDLARRLDKKVSLEIVGEATEVDRDILDQLEAPLTHLLRNAVDHGLEPAEKRQAAGKTETGVIRLEACHRAGMLVVTVADDGGGIDVEHLRSKVVERGLTSPEMARSMSEAELLEFLFLPGFSTAPAVTEFSGRGVGLDVVQDMVRRVGGSVHMATRLDQGTTLHLQLPITLSVLRAVLVDIGGEPYAFPHTRIDRLIRIPRAGLDSLENRQFVAVDGRNVGLVLAAQLFDMPAQWPPGEDLPVVLVSDASGQYGLIVDSFRGEQDLVVRPLDPRLGKVPNLNAAAILDDGSPVLIVDVEDLIRSMDQLIQTGTLARCKRDLAKARRRKRVLVVDDSITVREVERQILRQHGYEVAVAVDGQDGWNVARAEEFDLVIADVDMPRMNGLQLVQALRADGRLGKLPVIIVSYKDREEDRLRGLEVGANSYLTKGSFHDETFLRVVTDLIGDP